MTRRVLYDEATVRRLFTRLRAQVCEMDARRVAQLRELGERHAAEVARLRAEVDEVRREFDALRSVSLARQKLEGELGLRRLQAIGRARAAERDPALPLQ